VQSDLKIRQQLANNPATAQRRFYNRIHSKQRTTGVLYCKFMNPNAMLTHSTKPPIQPIVPLCELSSRFWPICLGQNYKNLTNYSVMKSK